MATYESDEEQIEALKSWWKENGTSLIIGVVVVLAVLFSSRQWQSSQTSEAGAASDLYEKITQIAQNNQGMDISSADFTLAKEANALLREEYTSSIYAHFSALLMAKLYVETAELDNAATELNWILDNPELGVFKSADDELFLTARSRLARVVLAQGDAQAALDLVTAIDAGTMSGSYAEIEGDAYIALGQTDGARQAYQRALEKSANPALLQLKLEDLGE